MTDITLRFDKMASDSITHLMKRYKAKSKAQLISKGLAMLKLAAHIQDTKGELFVRKGAHETRIIV